ncbi:MAG: AIR synthase related protein [Actinomycetota bacterium]|nr:AIR synthase related protein [Actinomycetota bacterium]
MGPQWAAGPTLTEVAHAIRSHPGVRNKAPIALVSEVLGASDWYHGPGDDGAVVTDGDVTMVVGGEALWPPFAAADPYGAGLAAVLTNVNDLAAMGARPLAIVDTIVGGSELARSALSGMRDGGALYQVPIVGGHLSLVEGASSISAFGLGRADHGQVLSVRHAAAGQSLMVACVTEGTMREDFPFFRSFEQRGGRLAGDVRVLAQVAADGSCVAAKDVSMAGMIGSLVMLLEYSRLGVTVDLDALPRPAGVALVAWLTSFPCFAFLLCCPPGREVDCARPFLDRGIQAEVVGTLDTSGLVQLRQGDEIVPVFDLHAGSVTGLGRAGGADDHSGAGNSG